MDKRSFVAMILLVTLSLVWINLFQPWLSKKMHWNAGVDQAAAPSLSQQPPATSNVTTNVTTNAAAPATGPTTAPAIANAAANATASNQNITTAPTPGVNSVKGSVA